MAKFSAAFANCLPMLTVVLVSSPTALSAIAMMANSSHSGSGNLLNETNSPLPPTKSLFSALFQDGGNNLKSINPFPLPLRESYIAFEQAHPSSEQDPGQFIPSKFPRGFDSHNYLKIQNTYPQSPFYPPYLPPPPPPPPPPFLRLVKIPGDLKISVNAARRSLVVICEFPESLLIIQQIYWHVIPPPNSVLLPYGTFYDSRNGFVPRVTVTSVSKWKSVLSVEDYTEDDYGEYRCVSSAILPDESEPVYVPPPPPPTTYMFSFPHESLELRSSAATPTSTDEIRRHRKLKYRNKREVGAFGVYAPFFKPQYGIFRVYKEVSFYGDNFGAGSEQVESSLTPDKKQERAGVVTEQKARAGGRRFDMLSRKSKVLF